MRKRNSGEKCKCECEVEEDEARMIVTMMMKGDDVVFGRVMMTFLVSLVA